VSAAMLYLLFRVYIAFILSCTLRCGDCVRTRDEIAFAAGRSPRGRKNID